MSRSSPRDAANGPLPRPARVHPLWWLTTGAIALRLLLFLGRGDYVAFDEGWYLLLGRNLLAGDGYTLSGLRHIALSPLFPILAAATDLVIGNAVWAGRIVAAVAAGLLVIPCWFLFRRMGGRRTTLLACILIAVMPSLAPFVVPFWIGWDLWVGAEPLLHLFLYAGVALALRARERSRPLDWALAGAVFGIAYLARPEAVITAGFLGLWLLARLALRPQLPRLAAAVTFALAFAVTAAPYWIYLHDVTGRWLITGRDVAVTPQLPSRTAPQSGETRPVEQMLWDDDDAYAHRLYALDASGRRLADGYWGVPAASDATMTDAASPPPAASTMPDAVPPDTRSTPVGTAVARSQPAAPVPPAFELFIRALRVVLPLYVWFFAAIGAVTPRRARREELIAALPIAATAVVIAVVVAVDPRTQLMIVPLVAFYAARGIRVAGVLVEKPLRRRGAIRRGFAVAGIAVVIVAALFATDARRLYVSLEAGSPHHLVGAANRRVGEALRQVVPEDESVMSWHPALALYARRDWRVLPHASFDRVVRFANVIHSEYLVLSAYYPSPLPFEQLPREYLVVHVPRDATGVSRWRLEMASDGAAYVYAVVRPASSRPVPETEEDR